MSTKRAIGSLQWVLALPLLTACGSTEGEDFARVQQRASSDALSAAIQQTTSWGTGYCANVNITNHGSSAVSTWTVVMQLNQASIYTSWNGNVTGSGSLKTVTPVGWNAVIQPAGTQSFGYCANVTGSSSTPQIISPLGGTGGTGGAGGTGGTATGGTATGGTATGGTETGGTATGGTATGGTATGGTETGGTETGGTETGGTETGGTETGGTETGGAAGAETGGAETGGTETGGTETGGTETGGTETGGTETGGTETGGTETGGAAGDAGYTPVSEYLQDPDRAIPVLASLADFRARARDDANGGFFTFVNSNGYPSSDRRKGFVTTTRDAWTFSRAFMVTGDETYLDHAEHALEHLRSHGQDTVRGGWYFTGDVYGNLTPYSRWWDPNTWKWSFVQHYALLGIGAYCDAAHDAATCTWLQQGRTFLDTKMWDATPGRLGYYDQANLDLSSPRNKGFTPTVDALTTHAIQMDLLWTTPSYQQRLLDLADITADRLTANMDLSNARFGYPENYTSSWSVDASQTGGDVGHVLKSAWVLARVYLRHPDERYREAARELIYEVLDNGGWDYAHGVPYTRYNWSTGQVTHQAECWQIEQAITGGLSNAYIADNPADRDAFLEMADRSLQFFDQYVIDHVSGGTYKMNSVTGAPTDSAKSNFFNVEYHSTETFYFTYLYGNLMLNRTPVALYYRVPASTSAQVVKLTPLAIDDASMQIQSVSLDGQPLTTFTAATREVTLAAGQGGKLRVVFGPAT